MSLCLAFAEDCPISDAFEMGTVVDDDLVEASGLAASRLNPGVLYSHNDKGEDFARIFAFLENGERIGIYL